MTPPHSVITLTEAASYCQLFLCIKCVCTLVHASITAGGSLIFSLTDSVARYPPLRHYTLCSVAMVAG